MPPTFLLHDFCWACDVWRLNRYQSYKLGEVKDFDSLFFPEKKNLLKILEHFQKKTGNMAFVFDGRELPSLSYKETHECPTRTAPAKYVELSRVALITEWVGRT